MTAEVINIEAHLFTQLAARLEDRLLSIAEGIADAEKNSGLAHEKWVKKAKKLYKEVLRIHKNVAKMRISFPNVKVFGHLDEACVDAAAALKPYIKEAA